MLVYKVVPLKVCLSSSLKCSNEVQMQMNNEKNLKNVAATVNRFVMQ